jgi:hypothetical protein
MNHCHLVDKEGAAEQLAEKVENYPAMEWNFGTAMAKIPTSQVFKINSGFLTPIKTIGAQKPCFVRNDP